MGIDRNLSTIPQPVPVRSFEALLRELVDEEHYPRLYRLAWSAGTEGDASPAETERKEFLLGINLILDGVEALITRAQRSGPAENHS